jgi:hypothetical protein
MGRAFLKWALLAGELHANLGAGSLQQAKAQISGVSHLRAGCGQL